MTQTNFSAHSVLVGYTAVISATRKAGLATLRRNVYDERFAEACTTNASQKRVRRTLRRSVAKPGAVCAHGSRAGNVPN